MKYRCPCCNMKTFDEKPGKSYDICPVCMWEDDRYQNEHPDELDGANRVSLNEAKANYKKYGACEKRFSHIVRKPQNNEM